MRNESDRDRERGTDNNRQTKNGPTTVMGQFGGQNIKGETLKANAFFETNVSCDAPVAWCLNTSPDRL